MSEALLFTEIETPLPAGVLWWKGALNNDAQRALLDEIAAVIAEAPLYRPRMRNGTPLVNAMTNCGPLGWYSDEKGYRYIDRHPVTGRPWPPIPTSLRAISDAAMAQLGIAGYEPDACLVNAYGPEGRLSLHQDHDEVDFRWPIVSVSLGADAVFALGGRTRKERTTDLLLKSGDVLVLHGEGRMLFHGVKRVRPGTAPFDHPALKGLSRINLTMRRAQ